MAACGKEIHVGDIGTDFRVTLYDCDVVVNLLGATLQELIFLKPDGTTMTVASTFLTDGTDGIVHYLTVLDDLDQEGSWKIQAHVVLPTGEWRSDIEKFKVWANLG